MTRLHVKNVSFKLIGLTALRLNMANISFMNYKESRTDNDSYFMRYVAYALRIKYIHNETRFRMSKRSTLLRQGKTCLGNVLHECLYQEIM